MNDEPVLLPSAKPRSRLGGHGCRTVKKAHYRSHAQALTALMNGVDRVSGLSIYECQCGMGWCLTRRRQNA